MRIITMALVQTDERPDRWQLVSEEGSLEELMDLLDPGERPSLDLHVISLGQQPDGFMKPYVQSIAHRAVNESPRMVRLAERNEERELRKRYGLPNATGSVYDRITGKGGLLFIDDQTGHQVAWIPPQAQP